MHRLLTVNYKNAKLVTKIYFNTFSTQDIFSKRRDDSRHIVLEDLGEKTGIFYYIFYSALIAPDHCFLFPRILVIHAYSSLPLHHMPLKKL